MNENNIDFNKCLIVIKCLNEYFKENNNIALVDYPNDIIYCSNEYFIYMFYSCLLDYGMRSKLYHNNLINTYRKYKNIFNPKYVISMEEEDLRNIIVNNIHPRYPNIAVKKWVRLSNYLSKYTSILNVLEEFNNFNELMDFINNIKCFGQKTGGLLIRIISDSKICKFNEFIKSIPIDRHDIEISYLTGIISDFKINEKEIKGLSNTYVNASLQLNLNPSEIDKYLWDIGSSFCNKRKCLDCPLNKICSRGMKQ